MPSPSNPSAARRYWVALLCVFLVSLPAVTPRIYSSDEVAVPRVPAFALVRSRPVVRQRVPPLLRQRHRPRPRVSRDVPGAGDGDGAPDQLRRRSGCAILWAPFYAAGDLVAHAAGAPVDGYSKPYIAAVAYGSARATASPAILIGLLVRAPAGPGRRRGGAPRLVRHAAPVLHVRRAAVLARVLGVRRRAVHLGLAARARTWAVAGVVALGAAAALMAMVREQDAFFAAGPATRSTCSIRRRGRARRPAPACRGRFAGIARARRVHPAGVCVSRAERPSRPARVGRAQDGVDAPHALQVLGIARARFLRVDAAGAARDCRARLAAAGADRAGAAPSAIAGAWRCAAADGRAAGRTSAASVESWTIAGAFAPAPVRRALVAAARGSGGAHQRPAGSRVRGIAATRARAGRRRGVLEPRALPRSSRYGLMDRQRLEPGRNAYAAFVTIPARSAGARVPLSRSTGSPSTGGRPMTPGPRAAHPVLWPTSGFRSSAPTASRRWRRATRWRRAGMQVTLLVRDGHPDAGARSVRLLRSAADRRRCASSARRSSGPPAARRPRISPTRSAGQRDARGRTSLFTRDLGVASVLLRIPRRLARAARLRVARHAPRRWRRRCRDARDGAPGVAREAAAAGPRARPASGRRPTGT